MNFRTISALPFVLAAWGIAATPAIAQTSEPPPTETKTSPGKLKDLIAQDMPLGVSPASFLLGASGENVPRVAAFREAAVQFARAYNEQGEIANAVAVDIAPLLALRALEWETIQSKPGLMILANTTVSLATKVRSAETPARSAIGVQSILYSSAASDVRRLTTERPCVPAKPDPSSTALPPNAAEDLAKCVKAVQASLTKWNQSTVVVGGGRIMPTSGAKSSNAYWLTAAFGGDWTEPAKSGSLPKEDDPFGYLVTTHLRKNSDVSVLDSASVTTQARQRLTGVNARLGTAKFAFMGEYSLAKYNAAGHSFSDRKRMLIGCEYRLAKDLFIAAGYAKDTGAPKEVQALMMRLQFGFSEKPIFGN